MLKVKCYLVGYAREGGGGRSDVFFSQTTNVKKISNKDSEFHLLGMYICELSYDTMKKNFTS